LLVLALCFVAACGSDDGGGDKPKGQVVRDHEPTERGPHPFTPERAAARKQAYLSRYRKPGAESAWHFLSAQPGAIARITDAAGFRYAWDAETRQFAHPAGVLVATPDGRIARYLYGIEYAPKDLRLSLVEAAQGNIGTAVDQVLLYCYQYDPAMGRYGAAVMRLLRAASLLTLLALSSFVVLMIRRERLQRG